LWKIVWIKTVRFLDKKLVIHGHKMKTIYESEKGAGCKIEIGS